MAKKSDEKTIEAGKEALRRQYYANVRSTAKDILEDAASQYSSYDDAQEYIDERIREDADGSYWVIYTHAALDTLFASDNWLAIEDLGIEMSDNLTTIITQSAYAALEQDLRAQVEAERDDFFREENPRSPRKRVTKSKLLR